MLYHFLAVLLASEAERRQEKSGDSIAATQPVTHHLAHLRWSQLLRSKSVFLLKIHARADRYHPVLCRCDAGRMTTRLGRRGATAADDGSDQGLNPLVDSHRRPV